MDSGGQRFWVIFVLLYINGTGVRTELQGIKASISLKEKNAGRESERKDRQTERQIHVEGRGQLDVAAQASFLPHTLSLCFRVAGVH